MVVAILGVVARGIFNRYGQDISAFSCGERHGVVGFGGGVDNGEHFGTWGVYADREGYFVARLEFAFKKERFINGAFEQHHPKTFARRLYFEWHARGGRQTICTQFFGQGQRGGKRVGEAEVRINGRPRAAVVHGVEMQIVACAGCKIIGGKFNRGDVAAEKGVVVFGAERGFLVEENLRVGGGIARRGIIHTVLERVVGRGFIGNHHHQTAAVNQFGRGDFSGVEHHLALEFVPVTEMALCVAVFHLLGLVGTSGWGGKSKGAALFGKEGLAHKKAVGFAGWRTHAGGVRFYAVPTRSGIILLNTDAVFSATADIKSGKKIVGHIGWMLIHAVFYQAHKKTISLAVGQLGPLQFFDDDFDIARSLMALYLINPFIPVKGVVVLNGKGFGACCALNQIHHGGFSRYADHCIEFVGMVVDGSGNQIFVACRSGKSGPCRTRRLNNAALFGKVNAAACANGKIVHGFAAELKGKAEVKAGVFFGGVGGRVDNKIIVGGRRFGFGVHKKAVFEGGAGGKVLAKFNRVGVLADIGKSTRARLQGIGIGRNNKIGLGVCVGFCGNGRRDGGGHYRYAQQIDNQSYDRRCFHRTRSIYKVKNTNIAPQMGSQPRNILLKGV